MKRTPRGQPEICRVSSLARAFLALYERGYFPMADENGDLRGYCYDPRGVLPLQEFHIPRRLQRWLRQNPYTVTHNQAFEQVIQSCGQRKSTWISTEISQGFCQLHRMGLAHSWEAWHQGQLVGGLYGLALGGTFCGESMFQRADHASKVCLVELVTRLRQAGFDLIDCVRSVPAKRPQKDLIVQPRTVPHGVQCSRQAYDQNP